MGVEGVLKKVRGTADQVQTTATMTVRTTISIGSGEIQNQPANSIFTTDFTDKTDYLRFLFFISALCFANHHDLHVP